MSSIYPKNTGENKQLLNWIKVVLVVLVVISAFRLVQPSEWFRGMNLNSSSLTLGVAFLVGFVASLSSCLVVVGSIVIAFGEKYNSGSKNIFNGVIKPNLFFHAGRIITFFALGGVLGALGGTININGGFLPIYSILIAIIMGWLGLSILGIVPSIASLGLRPPKFITRFWARTEKAEHLSTPFLLGGITFFLPCGFTQSMQLLALASGSFWRGAMILTIFSLGTMPILLLLGISASWGKVKNLEIIQKAAGILIIFFAFYTFQSGVALLNFRSRNISLDSGKYNVTVDSNSREEQIVSMTITPSGFEPDTFNVKKDTPVRWVINGDQATGCTNKIVVPSYEIAKKITSGENIIKFLPRESGKISFSCGMGMVRGKFMVQ